MQAAVVFQDRVIRRRSLAVNIPKVLPYTSMTLVQSAVVVTSIACPVIILLDCPGTRRNATETSCWVAPTFCYAA